MDGKWHKFSELYGLIRTVCGVRAQWHLSYPWTSQDHEEKCEECFRTWILKELGE